MDKHELAARDLNLIEKTGGLPELIEWLENANGPSRYADLLIMRWVKNIGGDPRNALPYTASLDAAMSLVPPEYRVAGFAQYGQGMGQLEGKWTCSLIPRDLSGLDTYEKQTAELRRASAATPELALCAAALRAGG